MKLIDIKEKKINFLLHEDETMNKLKIIISTHN